MNLAGLTLHLKSGPYVTSHCHYLVYDVQRLGDWTIMKSDSNQHFISQPSDLSLTNYLCFMLDFFLYLKVCMARWQRHNAFWTQEGGQFHVQQTMGTSQPSWQTWHTRCEMSGAHRSGIMEGHGEQHGRKSRWKDEKSDRSKVSLIEPVWWYCD